MPEPRQEREAVLRCPGCDETVYILYRRQVVKTDGSIGDAWGHVLWPTPGSSLPPPLNPQRLSCPDCDAALVRVPA